MRENPHVAVVDDDKIFHLLAKKVLVSTEFGGQISEFYDGQEALTYLMENQHDKNNIPDIIFLDIQMPFLDGWQFLDQFATLVFEKVITIYIVSSSISLLDHDKARRNKAVKSFIVKPFTREKLLEVIEDFKTSLTAGPAEE